MPEAWGEIILYQTEDGRQRLEVRLENETVWLTQLQMAQLFNSTVPNISMHIRNILKDKELPATIKEYLTVQSEGKRQVQRIRAFYNLDMILAVGYRVRSKRGTQFRQWATERLREYLVKGFTMDDARLKQAGGSVYFNELLARIRDIRSSEKVFWRKVLDIYATSVDYDPDNDLSQEFFAVVQNKMHWAAHGHTAAEIIAERADAGKPHMGMTSWTGTRPVKADAAIAKNYLQPDELEALNRIVTAYLEFAELQALQQRVMHMRDWIAKLDDFLKLSGRNLLTHAGRISAKLALDKAEVEYANYQTRTAKETTRSEQDFLIAAAKRLEGRQRTPPRRRKRTRR